MGVLGESIDHRQDDRFVVDAGESLDKIYGCKPRLSRVPQEVEEGRRRVAVAPP
jgi:hypothetical protein